MDKIFAASEPGFEEFTLCELCNLGIVSAARLPEPKRSKVSRASAQKGGVEFTGSSKAIYRVNLGLRTASRVLVRMGSFHASAFSELRKKAGRLEWERYLKPGQSVALKVTCRKSRLYHSDAVAERIVGAISDRLNRQTKLYPFDEAIGNDSPQMFIVRLVNDKCVISVDSSGYLLHRRGYRLATAKAPLRETLSAGIIMAAGWDGDSPLIDPFCGSGTIPIEAALMAQGIAPGNARHFAFMDWPNFDPVLWKNVLSDYKQQTSSLAPEILASDRDAGAIRMAQENAERAGVADYIKFSCQPVSAIEPTGKGWIVTNPPYGLRTSASKDLRNLYAQFGNTLKAKFLGWHVAILCNDLQLLGNTGIRLDTSQSSINGGVPVKLARGIVEG